MTTTSTMSQEELNKATLAVMNVTVPGMNTDRTLGELFGSDIIEKIVVAAQVGATPSPVSSELVEALRPFAEFAPSLREWHNQFGQIKAPHPKHQHVLYGEWPADNENVKFHKIYPADFFRAEKALAHLDDTNVADIPESRTVAGGTTALSEDEAVKIMRLAAWGTESKTKIEIQESIMQDALQALRAAEKGGV